MNLFWAEYQHTPQREDKEWVFFRNEMDSHKRLSSADHILYEEEQQREKEFVDFSMHNPEK